MEKAHVQQALDDVSNVVGVPCQWQHAGAELPSAPCRSSRLFDFAQNLVKPADYKFSGSKMNGDELEAYCLRS